MRKVVRILGLETAASAVASASIRGCPRITACICRNRHRPQSIDDILILCRLRSRKAQSLIFIAQSLSFICRKIVNDTVAHFVDGRQCVAVVCLHVEAGLHRLFLCITAAAFNLSCELVGVHHALCGVVLNRRSGVATTLCELCLNCVSVLQGLITEVAYRAVKRSEIAIDGVVQRKSAVADTIVYAIKFAFKVGEIGGKDIAVSSTSAAVAITPTISAPHKEE